MIYHNSVASIDCSAPAGYFPPGVHAGVSTGAGQEAGQEASRGDGEDGGFSFSSGETVSRKPGHHGPAAGDQEQMCG